MTEHFYVSSNFASARKCSAPKESCAGAHVRPLRALEAPDPEPAPDPFRAPIPPTPNAEPWWQHRFAPHAAAIVTVLAMLLVLVVVPGWVR